MNFQNNFPLKEVCTFKIGGPAKFFITCKSIPEFFDILEYCREHQYKIFVFGGGTNLLFPDEGLNGVVIKMMNSQIELLEPTKNDARLIKVGAGTNWAQLQKFCSDNSLYGLEAFSGLPGTIGGAIFGNAGAHKVEMKDVLESVKIFDLKTWTTQELLCSEIVFEYRHSSFKKFPEKIILEAILKVSTNIQNNTGNPIEFAEFRKQNQPQGLTTGSFFKNPPNNFAGKLIEESGMKDFQIGGITTSSKHANFFINLGDATAKDVLILKDLVVATVKDKTGVELVPEVQLVNSDRLISLA